MKKFLALVAVSALVLAGCGKHEPAANAQPVSALDGSAVSSDPDVTEVRKKLADGRTVTCVAWVRSEVNGGGLSCDWANAK